MTIHRCTFKHCTNIACGLYEVTTKRAVTMMVLCADCALDKVPNMVTAFVADKDKPSEELRFYRPVKSVRIIHLFQRESTAELDRLNGAKAYISSKPCEPVQVLAVYAPSAPGNAKVVTKFRRPLKWQSHQDMQRGDS